MAATVRVRNVGPFALDIRPGGTFVWISPNATGTAVTASTADVMTPENMLKARRMCEAFDEQAEACVVAA